jgi:hypothetical protein
MRWMAMRWMAIRGARIGLAMLAGGVVVMPAPVLARAVVMVCNGQFVIDRAVGEAIKHEAFDASMYLTVSVRAGQVDQVRLVPTARTRPMASLDLARDAAAGIEPEIRTSDDMLYVRRSAQSGPMIHAVIGDDPFAKTPVNLHEVKLQMNRFSGGLKIDWYWHQVRDYRPLGAIRAVKKRYSDHKSFTADCDLMKKRLF